MKRSLLTAIFASTSFFSMQAQAGLIAELGLHLGGDELASVSFTAGPDQSVDAGALISLALGAQIGISEEVDVRFSVGTKFDTVTADNGDIEFSRTTLDGLLIYRASEEWHIGAGFTAHSGVEFTGSGFASGLDVDFDNATGALLTFEYQNSKRSYFAGRVTLIDYVESSFGGEINGNSVGIVIGYRFGD